MTATDHAASVGIASRPPNAPLSTSDGAENGRPTLTSAISVRRSDPVYMAHAYLTKVPVAAITPFIEAFTKPGDIVLDPFAGSGMTGVAAAVTGRRARLFDVSVLGRHIGTNYVNLVAPDLMRQCGEAVLRDASRRVGNVYGVRCGACSSAAQLVKTVWSAVLECRTCSEGVNYYRALEHAGWSKQRMACLSCGARFGARSRRLAEEPVLDSIRCLCSRTQLEQEHTSPLELPDPSELSWPDVPIAQNRQMYIASALGRNGLTSTGAFYSQRNLCVLGALRDAIEAVSEPEVRAKLLFAFTAILTRASKRYQWSRQRPLNAANANYYVAPVFYEWNVFDLFDRKVTAAIRSDEWIREHQNGGAPSGVRSPDVVYSLASANQIPLGDNSVDYVFTDPPFGANIFYSDMNLFQEAWLSDTTDPDSEAVVDRVDTGAPRTAERYERMLVDALRECRRVVKPVGHITLLFGNSSGAMWQLLQRALTRAGLEPVPELIAVLDKGQRSVKGLASGFENVSTLDLMLTLRPASNGHGPLLTPAPDVVDDFVLGLLARDPEPTPSRLYLALLRHGLTQGWDLSHLDLQRVTALLSSTDVAVDHRSARVLSTNC
ncbi:MAG: DNA methylase [Acidimicrobiia bacterium]|nr:DNA methylase [Acidimicrobiia bacterium]MYC45815.1 DNA methylase [Acidimicrobiia bacterium]